MKTRPASLVAFFFVVLILTVFFLRGLGSVPFHPDESTYIYTSSDVELFWQQPSALFWRLENEAIDRQRYRELNAPLTNLFIFIGRWLVGEPPLARDWDWAKTWQQNEQSGAMPSANLLLSSRLAIAILFPLSMVFLFLTTYRIANEFTAWTGALLLASNALVLLHSRRAMAEGVLLFTSVLTLWSLVQVEKKRWLISIPAALAFCAKQSLIPLLPLGLAANFWVVEKSPTSRIKHIVNQSLLYCLSVLIILLLLHPFLWGQPGRAITVAFQARQALASAQIADRPDQVLNTPERRLISMISCLYLTPPIFAETGNYLGETRSAEQAYLDNPLHSLFQSIPVGGLLLILNLFGFSSGFLRAMKEQAAARRRLVLLLLATFLQTMALFWLIPLPWQRYYLPLVPYTCLWTAFGIDQFRQAVLIGLRTKRTQASH